MNQLPQVAELAGVSPPLRRPFQFRLIHLLVAMGVISVMLAVLVPLYRMARAQRLRHESVMNLKMIAIGLHNYHDTFFTFPPAYQCDASGKPAHSWRVPIVPFLESGPFASNYNFAEPWNGPNNSKLSTTFPHFRAPGDRTNSPFTSYVAITGPGTAWPGAKGTKLAHFTDGTSNTILVVEISHSDIHWMEPRDLPIEELEVWLDPNHKPRLGGEIEGGFVAYADGSVHYLPRDVTIKELRALLSPAGNDMKDVPPGKY